MSPKAKEFYNKLVSFSLNDDSVYARLENSYQYFIRKNKSNIWTNITVKQKIPFLEGSQRELESYFTLLSDAEISEVMKTFKMRRFPAPESQVMINGNVVTFRPVTSAAVKGFKNSPIIV